MVIFCLIALFARVSPTNNDKSDFFVLLTFLDKDESPLNPQLFPIGTFLLYLLLIIEIIIGKFQEINVFDVTGKRVAKLLKKNLIENEYNEIVWDSINLPIGLYFASVQSDKNQSKILKVVIE